MPLTVRLALKSSQPHWSRLRAEVPWGNVGTDIQSKHHCANQVATRIICITCIK